MEVRVGQIWRSDTGGVPDYVVAVDDRFAYVVRADDPKRKRSQVGGSYTVALSEFANWTLLQDAPAAGEDARSDPA